jgi:hypothetical protein
MRAGQGFLFWLLLCHFKRGRQLRGTGIFAHSSRQARVTPVREEPDLQLAGLSIWVLGHTCPNQNDWWDGNFLNVRVRVEAAEAVVEAHGPIIHAANLESFTNELELLYSTLKGNAC